MLVIPPTIGVLLILFGIALFTVDLIVTNQGLPTAGGIVTLLAGGLSVLGAGVTYSGVLPSMTAKLDGYAASDADSKESP